ncbi:pimeloyl-ACP methyl ester carboxylesterase/DNA-binding CsgD family transcriptional regulator [Actinoplanes lutulentus]|uniref:Alpha/beta hydrolase family protein n=1 Tax=Actinoplanes lutulentus TaxID=1287878 RepID=A0A327Z083_9ACTN|nr:alpha/beta fold hydrolase [Actinoplanes lutulentus]MBB2940455.1 pimeloyl-ACP methyl ester carboxylesterase/DNA-binding CsgD family transcriptional regulator [Actinoplanes lutulentus]RAK25813.1 alpha/beta hydrolase family protein [Actinoplanes lutulentus]
MESLRFARADDGVTIGYQMFGQGPVLVWMPSLSNIVAQWRIPALRDAYLGLARSLTVILYDGRGTGSSDRRIDLDDLGVEAHLRDLRAVLDHAGVQRASLLGYYHSVATALAFAARSPARVDRLVLFGGAARMREAMIPAQTQALLSLVDQDWGLFADAAATAWLGWDSAPSGRWTAEAFRTATSAAVARAWFDAAERIDVTEELARVRVPSLIVHRQGEGQIPAEVSRRLAASLPDARLVERPGSTPTLFMEDAEDDLRLVTAFVTGLPQSEPAVSGALTPREREVLALLAAGGSNGEIARDLGIAVHTVERHLGNVYRKIGARGRTDAVVYALRMTENRHGA